MHQAPGEVKVPNEVKLILDEYKHLLDLKLPGQAKRTYQERFKSMTRPKDAKLNSRVVTKFKHHIQSHLKDDDFKSLFLNFFEEDYIQKTFNPNDRYKIQKFFKEFIVTIFGNYTIELNSSLGISIVKV
ncbi:hypothetical protein ACOI1C_10055 [Bacillus sp. DJP31]|uniref:hypothetical protein n=1 Tax=Bacillus sp. DJP31 TaxID=3409789 RepID=UPI003BB749C9